MRARACMRKCNRVYSECRFPLTATWSGLTLVYTHTFPIFSLPLVHRLFNLSLPPDWEQGAVLKPATKGKKLEVRRCYEFSQGWLRQSLAEARFSGTISSMGSRKFVKWLASSADQPYFSTRTSNRDHGFSLVMCRNSPTEESRKQPGVSVW